MKNLIKAFNDITKFKVFEIQVMNLETVEKEVILFNIQVNEENNTLEAQRIAFNEKEEKSQKIAFSHVDLDADFSLDENLQNLHEICVNDIIDSDFFRLI